MSNIVVIDNTYVISSNDDTTIVTDEPVFIIDTSENANIETTNYNTLGVITQDNFVNEIVAPDNEIQLLQESIPGPPGPQGPPGPESVQLTGGPIPPGETEVIDSIDSNYYTAIDFLILVKDFVSNKVFFVKVDALRTFAVTPLLPSSASFLLGDRDLFDNVSLNFYNDGPLIKFSVTNNGPNDVFVNATRTRVF